MKKQIWVSFIVFVMFLFVASAAFSAQTNAHYTFASVPPTGWTISTDKSLSSGKPFQTTVDSITGTPQLEAEKGILYRGVNKATGGYSDLVTGMTKVEKTVIPAATGARTVYIKLQTYGKTTGMTTSAGYWYWN